MPKRYTVFDFQKPNKSIYFFQRGKGNNVKTLEVCNVKTLEVYSIKHSLEVMYVQTQYRAHVNIFVFQCRDSIKGKEG